MIISNSAEKENHGSSHLPGIQIIAGYHFAILQCKSNKTKLRIVLIKCFFLNVNLIYIKIYHDILFYTLKSFCRPQKSRETISLTACISDYILLENWYSIRIRSYQAHIRNYVTATLYCKCVLP